MHLHIFNTRSSNFSRSLNKVFRYANPDYHSLGKSYARGAMAACLLCDTETKPGLKASVDLERTVPRSFASVRYFIDNFATFGVKTIPQQPDSAWFYTVWTAMESYFKLDGNGFLTTKDFVIDTEMRRILKNDSAVAFFEHFRFGKYIVCLCASQHFTKSDVILHFHNHNDTQFLGVEAK